MVEGEEGTKITVPTTETEFTYSGPFQPPSDTSLAFWSSWKSLVYLDELPGNLLNFLYYFIKHGMRRKTVPDFQAGINFLVEAIRYLHFKDIWRKCLRRLDRNIFFHQNENTFSLFCLRVCRYELLFQWRVFSESQKWSEYTKKTASFPLRDVSCIVQFWKLRRDFTLSQRIAILPEVLLLIINVTFFLFVPAKVYGTQWLAKSLVFNYTPREWSPVALVLSCLD